MRRVKIAILVEAGDWPPKAELKKIARRAVEAAAAAASFPPLRLAPASGERERGEQELSLVFTDDAGMRKLNKAYRGKDSATNVLSFPQAPIDAVTRAGAAPQPEASLLGDVILAAETVAGEATLAMKPLEDHMAHLIIHGFLHLLGYNHEREAEAEKMEQLERVALKTLGIPDPYASA